MRVRVAFAGVVLAGLLVAAGCGGGGGGGERLTKDEWIAQADAICGEATKKIDALGQPQGLADIPEFTDKAAGIAEEELGKLRALAPPAEDEETITKMLDLLEQQIGAAKKIGDAAKQGDAAAVQEAVAAVEPLNKESDQLAKDFGLKVCGAQG